MRARSRSTTRRAATLWTRPAEVAPPARRRVTTDISYPKSRSRTRRPVWASTSFMSSSRGFSIASSIALRVISWKTIRFTGTDGLRTSSTCQEIASPSRSSSVARYTSLASARAAFSSLTTSLLLVGHDPDRLEVVVHVDREPADVGIGDALRHFLGAARQVADVTLARLDGELTAAEEALDGARLRRRLDDHERFGHDVLSALAAGSRSAARRGSLAPRTPPGRSSGRHVVPRQRPPCQTARLGPLQERRLTCVRAPRHQPRSEGDHRLPEPLRRDRAVADHLRRDRSAHRFLPPRRLAAVHRRAPRVATAGSTSHWSSSGASSPRCSATRSAT